MGMYFGAASSRRTWLPLADAGGKVSVAQVTTEMGVHRHLFLKRFASSFLYQFLNGYVSIAPNILAPNAMEQPMQQNVSIDDPLLFDLAAAPNLRSLKAAIARLQMSADAKSLLETLARFTVTVAGKVVAVGRKILQLCLALVRTFPNMLFGAVVALALSMIVASIPLLGPPLSAILTPLLVIVGIGVGALADIRSGKIGEQVGKFVDVLDAALSGAAA